MNFFNSKPQIIFNLKNALNSTINSRKNLFDNCFKCLPLIDVAGYKDLADPPKEQIIGYPDQNRLKPILKQPNYPSGLLTPKMPKRVGDMRGPELFHNKLIHKQYGIVALSGGQLKYGHFEMMRSSINRKFDMNRVFAIWRVDSPWKAISRHGQGKKLGGGKGAIDHYTTPVKRGRIILEVGGSVPIEFLSRVLLDVAQKLPFPAKVISQKDLDQWQNEEQQIKTNNLNKLKWEWCIKNNILNVINYVGKYDIEYSHLGPDCR